MSSEIFNLIKQINIDSVELQVILQCAPVMARLKCANLLNIKSALSREAYDILKDFGLSMYDLCEYNDRVYSLVYKESDLIRHLSCEESTELLATIGYNCKPFELKTLLKLFSERYKKYLIINKNYEKFPHEMGLFLGYPIDDVKGFIENDGKDFLYCGYWKVYKDVTEKIKLFNKFQRAEEYYIKNLFVGGFNYGSNKDSILVTVR